MIFRKKINPSTGTGITFFDLIEQGENIDFSLGTHVYHSIADAINAPGANGVNEYTKAVQKYGLSDVTFQGININTYENLGVYNYKGERVD